MRSVMKRRRLSIPLTMVECGSAALQAVPPRRGWAGVGNLQVAAGPDLRVAQEQDAVDDGDHDPQPVAVDPAPVVQPVQDRGDDQPDPAHRVPLVPPGGRQPDEVPGQAGPAGVGDRVGEEPPHEVRDEVPPGYPATMAHRSPAAIPQMCNVPEGADNRPRTAVRSSASAASSSATRSET